ncbi:hypothetical protein ACIP1T_09660 [Pseudomonas japonica]|uniref:hypothetical protein n=1 Tax=Pseudomonas japonica TaxID=256466 RepID=UPI00381D49FA
MAIYVQGRLRRDEIPYVTDVLNSVQVIKDFDGFVVVLAVLGALLHISIVVSSILLIFGRRMGVYLGLLQIPFRLFYMLPSLSLLLMVAAYVPTPASWFLVACVVFSESAKTYSLWRILKCSRVGRVSSGAA